MELHSARSRLCDGWLRHLPVHVAQQGLDSVGHTRMGSVTTLVASMQGLSLGGSTKVSEDSMILLCIHGPWSCWAGYTWNVTFICQTAPKHAKVPFLSCSL